MMPSERAQADASPPPLAEQETAELLLGRRLDRYELLRALGRGGMGTVYLAQDTQLGREVALKLLPRRFTSDAERVRRFRQEARAISTLNHPNILTIHEIGTATVAAEEVHFLATEYVAGQTLRARLTGAGLTLGEVLDSAAQVAYALAAAHEAGIIHRDIKPENIMVRPDGLVKVLDFGLAKLTGAQTVAARPATFSTLHTSPGYLLGTISYMSPEQARGLEVDARSDIFSLGVVLYEMLSGRAPFAGATTGDVLVSILDREPPLLAHSTPAVPAALQGIVSRALAKERTARYQQARALHDDLKELKQELELAARLRQPGDTPAGTVSLNLRVGQTTVGEDAHGPAFSTQVAARPTDQSRRLFAAYGKLLALALAALALLATLALGWRWFAAPAKEFKTVAVLPFANQSGDAQLDYLSDGLTDSLMQNLQQAPGLRVMARGTVFSYKGREVDPRQVGRELTQVDAVVTGRVQRQGEQFVFSAELAETRDGTQLWSARYQRPLAELTALQTDLTRALTAQLMPRLNREQQQQVAKRYTDNAEAYRLYLSGLYQAYKSDYESGLKALEFYQQAIALDPAYALAYTGIADVYAYSSSRYLAPQEAMPKARAAALRALALDDTLAEAHQSLALIKLWGEWDWTGAEAEFQRALALNPNLAIAHVIYGNALSFQRRFPEFRRELQLAQQLDPLSSIAIEMNVWGLYFAREYDAALAEAQRLLALDPAYFRAAVHLGFIYRQKGQLREAIAVVEKALARQRREQLLTTLAYLYAVDGQPAKARALLAETEALTRKKYWVSPFIFAKADIGLGDHERAFTRLREAYAAHSEFLFALPVDPVFDPLRADPRFAELVRGVGLQP